MTFLDLKSRILFWETYIYNIHTIGGQPWCSLRVSPFGVATTQRFAFSVECAFTLLVNFDNMTESRLYLFFGGVLFDFERSAMCRYYMSYGQKFLMGVNLLLITIFLMCVFSWYDDVQVRAKDISSIHSLRLLLKFMCN